METTKLFISQAAVPAQMAVVCVAQDLAVENFLRLIILIQKDGIGQTSSAAQSHLISTLAVNSVDATQHFIKFACLAKIRMAII